MKIGNEILEAPILEDVKDYLTFSGWELEKKFSRYGDIWQDKQSNEILVPNTKEVDDYDARVRDIIITLSRKEDRDESFVYYDISNYITDVLRIRVAAPSTNDGSIILENAVSLLNNTQEIASSIAASLINAKSVYNSRKPDKVKQFTNSLRFSSTEHGSFVIVLFSRSYLKRSREQLIVQPTFERSVMEQFRSALNEIIRISDSRIELDDERVIFDAVQKGVSANVCVAINNIQKDIYASRLDFSFSWSNKVNTASEQSNTIIFTEDYMQSIERIATAMKSAAFEDTLRLRGLVTGLLRNEGDQDGKVTIATFIDNKPKHISFYLNQFSYSDAIKAHDNNFAVVVEGRVVQNGRSYSMDNITYFDVKESD